MDEWMDGKVSFSVECWGWRVEMVVGWRGDGVDVSLLTHGLKYQMTQIVIGSSRPPGLPSMHANTPRAPERKTPKPKRRLQRESKRPARKARPMAKIDTADDGAGRM